MIAEPPELVAMRLALGKYLAARREAAGIIQPQIARRTGYSRSSVAHAEAGRQLLTREFWQTADEVVEAGGKLLAHYEQVRAAKEEHTTSGAGRRSWPGRTLRLRPVLKSYGPTTARLCLRTGMVWPYRPDRRGCPVWRGVWAPSWPEAWLGRCCTWRC